MATEQDLINKFKDLAIPVGADFEELIHEAFVGANLADLVNNYDSRITTVENDLSTAKDSIQSNTNQIATKADDSKVVHSTITELNSTDMNTVKTAGFYNLNSGTNGMPNVDKFAIYQVIPLNGANGVQVAYETNKAILGMRSWNGWKNFTNWVQFADDSKVAHLSGANNFDTVPTVNNNPLLLASSLPADLARTTKDANFTGKLQKSGIDVATKSDVTTAVNTATANMVDSTKATNFTAGLQSGGVDVATAADLKSIEDSAWRQLDNKYISTTPTSNTTISSNTVILYKLDTDNKRIYLQGTILISSTVTNNLSTSVSIDLSSIAKTISYASGYYNLQYWGGSPVNLYGSRLLNNKLTMTSTNLGSVSIAHLSSSNQPSTVAYVTYDELV